MINPIFREIMSNGLILVLAGAVTILLIWLGRPLSTTTTTTTTTATTVTVRRRRGVQLRQVNPPAEGKREKDTGIDIIAIHGLDTNSPHTWEFKKEDGQKINWLADQHMLPAEVPGTRIFTCDWPAELLETKDSASLKIEELGLSLLHGILGSDSKKDRPILFVASCLGGIILMQALVEAKDEYASIREATRGIIFLATPFRGTSFQDVAMWAQPGLKVRASLRDKKVSKLLDWLNAPTYDLTRLVSEFTRLCKGRDQEGFEVFTFYETGYTHLAAQVPFLSFLLPGSKKPLVDMSSATLDCVPNPLPLHRNHSRMNKFCGPMDSDPDYRSVVEVIQRFLLTIKTGTPLEQADAWIREKHYDKQRLKIERLSGDPLDMGQCYINLALVEMQQAGNSKRTPKESSTFSLRERLNLEPPHEGLRVELSKLFEPRELPHGNTKVPRRVLIRGRAGVGKTTLCKKIVHDFIDGSMWQDLFKRVVWIRLRELKNLPKDDYNLHGILKHIFFRQQIQHAFLPDDSCNTLCNELCRQIENTQSRDTLFLLDGMDEVPELTMEYRHGNSQPGHEFIKGLLNRRNVIITTRPHATFPRDFQQPDLELDTMGFSPDQVQTYIEAVMPDEKVAIQAYLEKNRIMQSLVQIPIQLDALCFTWQTSPAWNNVIPETMTAVYEAMIRELWNKDNERLEKDGVRIIGNAFPAETDPFDSSQYTNLGYLAFSGLCNNVIEFQPHHRSALYGFMKTEKTSLSFDETFARLSFWRTSDPLNSLRDQSYHFIHLTFQEYFSAKHFVNAWRYDRNLEYVDFAGEKAKKQAMSCQEFVREHKFTARFNIMWRFVAGILDEEEEQASHFFEAIEREPIDLLGPSQQRLVMHCLAEVIQSEDLRTRLEEQLLQWLEFEINFRKKSQLVREAEFPERTIELALERASEQGKIAILKSLRERRILPEKTVEFITSWLEGGMVSQHLRSAPLYALRRQNQCLPNRTLNAVVIWLDDEDFNIRNRAGQILEDQSPWPENILRAVMTRLESQDSGIKVRTVGAVGYQLVLPETLIRTIASWLKDREEDTTFAALSALEFQSWLPEDIMPSIAAQLGNRDNDVARMAFTILNQQERLPKDILDNIMIFLEDEDRDEDEGHIYYRLQLSNDIMQGLTARCKSQDTNIQQKAMKVLLRESKEHSAVSSHGAFQILAEWLEDRGSGLRRRALTFLSNQSRLPENVMEAVGAHMKDQDQDLAMMASEIIRNQETLSPGIFQNMVTWLEDEDKCKKKMALEVLKYKDALPISVIKSVGAQLYDQDRTIRKAALETLRDLEAHQLFADDILHAVATVLEDADHSIRRLALLTLRKLSDERDFPHWVLKVIAQLLEDPGKHDRFLACSILANQSELPENTLQTMVARGLEDEDKWVNTIVLDIIKRRPTMPEGVHRLVVARLGDKSEEVRRSALEALASQVDSSEDTLSAIAGLLEDGNWGIRKAATELLGASSTLSYDLLQAITRKLNGPFGDVEQAAMEALGGQQTLPDTIFKSKALYSVWLEKSFQESVYCYIENGVSYLELPAGFGKRCLQGQPNELRRAIRERHKELGMPMRPSDQVR